jgi:hypothetical protein
MGTREMVAAVNTREYIRHTESKNPDDLGHIASATRAILQVVVPRVNYAFWLPRIHQLIN